MGRKRSVVEVNCNSPAGFSLQFFTYDVQIFFFIKYERVVGDGRTVDETAFRFDVFCDERECSFDEVASQAVIMQVK